MPNSHVTDEERSEPPAAPPERDLSAELERMEDRYKRALADLDNYRKRAARELDRLVNERADALLRDWLEVVDGLERAERQHPEGAVAEGLRAVRDQMASVLERHGVHRFGAAGEPFDPARHEAITLVETDEVPERAIADVLRSGYARGDHVLRPAQVVVARAPQHREA